MNAKNLAVLIALIAAAYKMGEVRGLDKFVNEHKDILPEGKGSIKWFKGCTVTAKAKS